MPRPSKDVPSLLEAIRIWPSRCSSSLSHIPQRIRSCVSVGSIVHWPTAFQPHDQRARKGTLAHLLHERAPPLPRAPRTLWSFLLLPPTILDFSSLSLSISQPICSSSHCCIMSYQPSCEDEFKAGWNAAIAWVVSLLGYPMPSLEGLQNGISSSSTTSALENPVTWPDEAGDR